MRMESWLPQKEKAEVLTKCFASVFTGGQAPPPVCQDPEALGVGERSRFRPTVTVEQVRDLLLKLKVYNKSMGLDDIHPRKCTFQSTLILNTVILPTLLIDW